MLAVVSCPVCVCSLVSRPRHVCLHMVVVRFVRAPFSRLVIAGAIFHAAALTIFVLAAAGAFGAVVGGHVAVTVTCAVGIVLHLALLLVNVMARAEDARLTEDGRRAFAYDQWYAVVGIVGTASALVIAVGLWLASGAALVSALVALALTTTPALTVLTFAVPLPPLPPRDTPGPAGANIAALEEGTAAVWLSPLRDSHIVSSRQHGLYDRRQQ